MYCIQLFRKLLQKILRNLPNLKRKNNLKSKSWLRTQNPLLQPTFYFKFVGSYGKFRLMSQNRHGKRLYIFSYYLRPRPKSLFTRASTFSAMAFALSRPSSSTFVSSSEFLISSNLSLIGRTPSIVTSTRSFLKSP